MNPHVKELLPRVRRVILQERAGYKSTDPFGFGLSWVTWQVGHVMFRWDKNGWPNDGRNRKRFTSGGLKTIRGHVQACLAILAREGIVFSRTHTEGCVARYEHGETDKRFLIRITQQDAKKRLAKMK